MAAGTDEEFGMEHKIFNCAIAVSIATLVPAFFFVLFQATSWVLSVAIFIANALYFYIYYLCRFANRLEKSVLVFVFTGGALLNSMWVIDRGVDGSAAFFIFIVILVITFTSQKPFRYLVALFVNVLVMSLIDDYLRSFVTVSVYSSEASKVATLLSAIVYLSILALLYKGLIHKKMDSTYKDVMRQLIQESATVTETADRLAENSEHLLAFTLQQKTATEQLAVTTEELGATAQQNSQLANSAMSAIRNTEHNIVQSKEIIDTLTHSMEKIRKSSEEIQTINNVINDISYQTNILSLNAMIEASRAESGSGGFKVVALEVKRLSERSATAANSINKLLASNFGYVQEGVNEAEKMRQRFEEISAAIHPLTMTIQNVNDASMEQHEAIRQITVGIDDIDAAVDENRKLVAEATARTSELRDNAESLMSVVHTLDAALQEP